MQQHDDGFENLDSYLKGMLRALPRERAPDAALEESIAQQLRVRRLIGNGKALQVRGARRAVAISWPAAAAAAGVLFASGALVGAAAGRGAPAAASQNSASASVADAAAHSSGNLLLAADKTRPVARAIKF